MNFPPLDKKILAKLGVAANATPARPNFDLEFEINLKPQKPETLTTGECIKLFGTREAVLMNFIPQMLTAIALEQAEEFVQYCAAHKLSDFKRHTREIRNCANEYNIALRKSYGRSWQVYGIYLDRLRQAVAGDLFKCWCTFTNEASRQYVGVPHREIPARVAFVRMLLEHVEVLDKKTDKVIADRIKAPCYRKQNPYCLFISVLCLDIAETFGRDLKITDTMTTCVKVLANRCRSVADDIMNEENAI